METKLTLATKYDVLSSDGRLRLDSVPQHIQENLNSKFTIRPYQKEALLRWFDYYESTVYVVEIKSEPFKVRPCR